MTPKILILGNGPSVLEHDLKRIDCAIIGLNQAWRLRECRYYCAADSGQFEHYAKAHNGDVSTWRPLFSTVEKGPEHAIKFKGIYVNGKKGFSFSPKRDGVYLNNTIASFALQIAVSMLGETGVIYLLGIDCHGKSFTGAETPEFKFSAQRETFGYIAGILECKRPEIKVYNLSLRSRVSVFEKLDFDIAFSHGEAG